MLQVNASECLANTCRAVYWTQRIYFGCSLSSALSALPTQSHATSFARDSSAKKVSSTMKGVGTLFYPLREKFAAAGYRYCVLPRVGQRGALSVLLKPTAEPVSPQLTSIHNCHIQPLTATFLIILIIMHECVQVDLFQAFLHCRLLQTLADISGIYYCIDIFRVNIVQ